MRGKLGISRWEQNSNFHQLLLLHGKDDPTVLKHRTRKYTNHHIQNELLQILALGHSHKIATSMRESGFSWWGHRYLNKEQLVVGLRWVDSQFEPHEEFIGLYHIEEITAETIVAVLKDTILRINLNLLKRSSQWQTLLIMLLKFTNYWKFLPGGMQSSTN